ncbi:MAG: potassium-transporting ATPase subunit KdpC [Dehalococcoidia bacterium]|jgi:K+-transporting ATPase ATPase C chain
MGRQLRSAVIFLAIFTIVTGVIYPLIVTGISQVVFHHQANGSLIESKDGKYLGSELIGQPFDEAGYFWGRPSATTPFLYNAASSSGSNYGPLNPALLDGIQQRIKALKAADPDNTQPIPVDLVTYSASGLDPHISIAAALYQVPRVARERGLNETQVLALIDRFTQGRQFGILGEPRVNVLLLNQALDQMK